MTTLDELLALEHAGWRALCEGTGADLYGGLMTDDGLMVLAHGAALDRDAVVASLRDAPPWRAYTLDDVRVLALADDAAVLVYRATATRDDGPAFTAWMSSTYVRRDGSWRLALYQQTPVPPSA